MEPKQKIEALRTLLLDEDRRRQDDLADQIQAIYSLIDTRSEMETRIDPIISDKLKAFSDAIPQTLGPAITAALKKEISNSRDQVVDALYPIIGKMIKKYIGHEIAVLKEQIEKSLKAMFSFKGLMLRLKCKFTGKSPAELLLSELNGPELEEMLVIENESGLLRGNYSRTENIDRDMIAGMLTAIKSFVEDAFQNGQKELEQIQYQDYKIHLFSFKSFYIAVIVSGNGSASFSSKLHDTVMEFAMKYLNSDNPKLNQESYLPNQLEQFFGLKLSKKVILVGHFGVGKTSLIQNYVHSRFSGEYLTTIGVNIEKKTMNINATELTTIIWDIAGEVNIDSTPKSYLLGAHGIVYVLDLERSSTWSNIDDQLTKIRTLLPFAPIRIVANKSDLLSDLEISRIKNELNTPFDFTSSAKTGENVELFFNDLGSAML